MDCAGIKRDDLRLSSIRPLPRMLFKDLQHGKHAERAGNHRASDAIELHSHKPHQHRVRRCRTGLGHLFD
jgi:hypothetical protein